MMTSFMLSWQQGNQKLRTINKAVLVYTTQGLFKLDSVPNRL